ncbi:MAG: hypothetical protein V1750_06685 [Acidobacteriota bacterium]
MSSSPLVLLASPDDYLVELERSARVAAWVAANPGLEVVALDPAPAPPGLLRELLNRSLFSPDRLLVIADARPYFAKVAQKDKEILDLATALKTLSLDGIGLLLAAVAEEEPAGPLVEVFRARGEVQFLPLPPPPKPWEEVRVSPAQRRVLEDVIRRVAPPVLEHSEAVDALCETYGFRVRELAQAAQRLITGGELTATAVRAQAGAGETSLGDLEDALRRRDVRLAAGFLATLAGGGALVAWRGERVDEERLGATLAGALGRLLRQALAVRAHARQAGLEPELDPRACQSSSWYPRVFKPRIHPRLAADIEGTPGSPLAGASPWALHHAFALAASYEDAELLAALTGLARTGAERAKAKEAVAAVMPVLLGLLSPKAKPRLRR